MLSFQFGQKLNIGNLIKDKISNYEALKIQGKLFNMLGFSKSRVEIIDNKTTFSIARLKRGIYVLESISMVKVENHQVAVK